MVGARTQDWAALERDEIHKAGGHLNPFSPLAQTSAKMPGAHIFGSWDNSIPIYLCTDDNFTLIMSLISSKMAPRGSLSKWVEEVSHCPWFWLLVDSPNHLTSNGSSIGQQTGKKLDIHWERANEWPWSSRYAFDGEAIWWNAPVYSTNFQETLSNANSTTTLSWKSGRMRSAPKPQMAHPSHSVAHTQLRLSTWKQSSLHESSRGWRKCKWVSVHQSQAQLQGWQQFSWLMLNYRFN